MIDKRKIIKEIEKRRDKLKAKGVKKIGLFGSYLKNESRKKSDIDFLVILDENSLKKYLGVLFYLENVFKKKIDLVIEKSLRPELKYVKKEVEYVTI